MRTAIRPRPIVSTLALALMLAACDGDDDLVLRPGDPPPVAAPAPAPAPTPTPSALSVTRCLDQEVAPGRSVASLVLPDVVSVDVSRPAGFPNGRRLLDPVIDVTLNVLLLDLTRHPATTFASLPLNPRTDRGVLDTFPFFNTPAGNPPLSAVGTGAYNFRTDPASAFVRVDRMGFAAVATALIRSPQRIPYNESNTTEDAAGRFVPEITAQLTALHAALDDDLGRIGLARCSTGG